MSQTNLDSVRVLQLDRNYQPVGFVGWERAISLLWEGKVSVVSEYDDKIVRSTTLEIPVPSVIRFLTATSKRKKQIRFSRSNIYARDNGRCQYCGIRVERKTFTYDHVNPRAKSGRTNWTNIVCACYSCNQKKGGRTPQEAGMKLLSTPEVPKSVNAAFLFDLPGTLHPSWVGWLKDQVASTVYWHAELESDE